MVFGGNPELQIVIKAVDEFTATFNKIGKSVKDSKGTLIGLGVVAGATFYGAVKAIQSSVDSFAEFNTHIQKAGANVNATEETLQKFKETAISATRGTSVSAIDAARALAFLAGGSVDAEEAMASLGDTIRFATAGNLSLERAAVVSSQAMTVFGIEAENVGGVLDVLTKANQISFATMEQLADSFSEAGPIAAQLGISITDLTAIIGTMGDAGILGSEAGVALKRAFKEILDPSKDMKEGLAELGLTTEELQQNLNEPIKIIEMLENSLVNITDPIKKATILSKIFGQISGPAIGALLSQGSEAIKNQKKELEGASGTLKELTDAINNATSPFVLLRLEMERVSLTLGDVLNPIIRDLFNSIQHVIERISAWIQEHPKLATALMVGIALISGLTVVVVGLAFAIGALTAVSWPIVLVVLAIVAAVAAVIAIIVFWKDIVSFLKDKVLIPFWEWLNKKFGPEIAVLSELIRLLGLAFGWLWENAIKPVWDKLVGFYDWIKDKFLWVIEKVVGVIGAVRGAINSARGAVSGAITAQTKKVGDFIITKQGQVLETSPNDTIMGMKSMNGMGGISITITGNIYGTNPDEIAEALVERLRKKISI